MNRRQLNLLGFLICVLLLAYAYFEQFHAGLEPCPLCIFQRIAVILLGLAFLAAGLHHPRGWGTRVYSVLIGIFALGGLVASGRHVWIQHLPPGKAPACGPGLGYLLKVFPLKDALVQAFNGSGECAVVNWQFLGLSMPEWVFLWFVFLGIAGIWVNWRRPREALQASTPSVS
jgi:disulfide bond formation protein DsbB